MHNPNGWYNLGKRYENGRGVSKDLVQAYACYDIAAMEYSLGADRDNAIKSRDRVAARMTPGQIAKAKKMETEPGAIVGSTQPGPTPPPAAAGEDILAVSRELIEFFNGKYKRLHPPRAIAVSADGFRWGYSYCGEYRCKIVPSARDLAMQACAQAGGRGCRIFAIDDDIKVKYRVVD
jgi:TPR repeat protein